MFIQKRKQFKQTYVYLCWISYRNYFRSVNSSWCAIRCSSFHTEDPVPQQPWIFWLSLWNGMWIWICCLFIMFQNSFGLIISLKHQTFFSLTLPESLNYNLVRKLFQSLFCCSTAYPPCSDAIWKDEVWLFF